MHMCLVDNLSLLCGVVSRLAGCHRDCVRRPGDRPRFSGGTSMAPSAWLHAVLPRSKYDVPACHVVRTVCGYWAGKRLERLQPPA